LPIYAYTCKNCDHNLDALQKMADAPLVDCPSCGKPELKRLLSAPRFRLKGQGWYETDFKKDNQRNIAGDKDSSKSESKKSGTKTDIKTDTKTGSKSDTKSTTTSKGTAK
jgi:putative FmdB family regulatory protein